MNSFCYLKNGLVDLHCEPAIIYYLKSQKDKLLLFFS